MFKAYLPGLLNLLLHLLMLGFVLRRAWLSIARKEGIPPTFVGFPKALAYVGAWSLALAVVGLLLSMLFRVGSGVPAGMLLLPAIVCVPWAFLLTEILSLRKVQRSEG